MRSKSTIISLVLFLIITSGSCCKPDTTQYAVSGISNAVSSESTIPVSEVSESNITESEMQELSDQYSAYLPNMSDFIDMNGSLLIGGTGILIGGVVNDETYRCDDIAEHIKEYDNYLLIRDNEIIGRNITGQAPSIYDGHSSFYQIIMDTEETFDFAMNNTWELFPRKPVLVDPKANDYTKYEAIISEILAQNGIICGTPPIREVYRIDLDNDGTEEILIDSSNISHLRMDSECDTFSMIYMLKETDGVVSYIGVYDFILPKDDLYKYEGWGNCDLLAEIVAIFDFDNDGQMEVDRKSVV